jgi:hypothetical protein
MIDVSCNATGAFVGVISSPLPPAPFPLDDPDIVDDRALLFNTFMVAPLLETRGMSTVRRFSGNLETGYNPSDIISQVADAFAHHVVEENEGTYMLSDIQGRFSIL